MEHLDSTGHDSIPAGAEKTRHHRLKLTLLLTMAGFLSGLVSISLMTVPPALLFFGLIFGALVGGCLKSGKVLQREGWAWFAVAAAGAQLLSPYLAGGVQMLLPVPPEQARGGPITPLPLALFVGGLFGAGLIMGTLFWLRRDSGVGRAAGRTIIGALAGGGLGVLGLFSARWLGAGLWYLLHALHINRGIRGPISPRDQLYWGEADFVYSLYLVWQTGMGLVIGLLLWNYRPTPEPKGLH